MHGAFVERSARVIGRQQERIVTASLDPVLTAELLSAMVDHTCCGWLDLGEE